MSAKAGQGLLDPDRLFPVEPAVRGLARELYGTVRDLPIVSPHGHTDPRWYAEDEPFPDPAQLFVVPDHYVFRMLCSQGVPLNDLGVPRVDGGPTETDGAQDLAALRRELPPVPRHPDAALARPHLRDRVRPRRAGCRPTTADRHLRPHRRLPRAGPSSARGRCSSASTSR